MEITTIILNFHQNMLAKIIGQLAVDQIKVELIIN